jgi:hypothetical protein
MLTVASGGLTGHFVQPSVFFIIYENYQQLASVWDNLLLFLGCSTCFERFFAVCILVCNNEDVRRTNCNISVKSNIQGGPKLGIYYVVYKLLYTYFWPTLYDKRVLSM